MKRAWDWLQKDRYNSITLGRWLNLEVSGNAFGWLLVAIVALVLLVL